MYDLDRRLAALSPEQRLLLEQRLQQQGLNLPKLEKIPRREQGNELPLSFAQTRLWFIQQLDPNNIAYNISAALHVQGNLQVRVLEQTFNEIVRRHEILRTSFISDRQGQPIQKIAPALSLRLPIVDFSETETPPARIQELAREEAQHPFDLTHAPLLRLQLLRLGAQAHVLLLTLHHIVCDRWSIGVLVRELSALYAAFASGKPSPLDDLPVQYGGYALRQRDWLQGETLERQLAYWRQQLGDAPPVLELPSDRPRPAVQTYRGAQQPLALPKSLSQALKRLCVEEGVTLYMLLLSAFKVLLYRYTNQDDIVVGTDIANRDRQEIEGAIGLFFNTLVLRTNLSGDPTFRELLRRVRDVALGAYSHQELPFEKLVEAINPERTLSRMPLFQAKFDLQQAPVQPLELPGLTVTPLPVDNGTTKFDLRFNLQDTDQGIVGQVEYSTDLFTAARIEREIAHFQALLESIVSDPNQRLSTLSVLTPSEQKQQQRWNQTQAVYPQDRCFPELFAEQVRRTPDAIALSCASQELTYRELEARANQLAHYLQQLGVGTGVLVSIYCDRSVEMLVALLGVLKAGGAYVPLDPSFPRDRLASILADVAAPIVLTQQQRAGDLPDGGATLVCLDRDWPAISRSLECALASPGSPNRLAYVIYTSGSTGQPKGVEVSHRALTNFLWAMGQKLAISYRDTWLAVTTIAFDIAALELYLPLLVGARLAIAEHTVARDGVRLAAQLDACAATVMQATPATWTLLLASGWQGNPNLTLLCGGEALSAALARQLRARGKALWNFYGPTESTIWSTVYPVASDPEEIVAIGAPIANTQVYLLDRDLQPVPVGVPGEVHIAGVGLARGYHNRPHLTAEKFIPNPFTDVPGERLYKTGDLARYRSDGAIAFLGRLDQQVKLRGFRIELGEIEATLTQHPDIAAAAVVMRTEAGEDKQLVAYVVPAAAAVPSDQDLRQFLSKTLPNYMLPGRVVALDTLPLTPNGKVNRRSLPAPDRTRTHGSNLVAPRTPTEAEIAKIWAQVLNLDAISIHENFFELGGHSLLATQVASRLHATFGVELPLQHFFTEPTVANLACHIDRLSAIDPLPTPSALGSTDEREEIEL